MVTSDVASVLAVVIKIPREAMVPLLVGSGVLLVLMFFGAALAQWKANHPGPAKTVGLVLGALLSLAAAYLVIRIFPIEQEREPTPDGWGGRELFSFFDGPIAGFIAVMAVIMWGWAKQRWVALGVGGALGFALVLKPFLRPQGNTWEGQMHYRSLMDPEHLTYLGPGIVVLITTLIVVKHAAQSATR